MHIHLNAHTCSSLASPRGLRSELSSALRGTGRQRGTFGPMRRNAQCPPLHIRGARNDSQKFHSEFEDIADCEKSLSTYVFSIFRLLKGAPRESECHLSTGLRPIVFGLIDLIVHMAGLDYGVMLCTVSDRPCAIELSCRKARGLIRHPTSGRTQRATTVTDYGSYCSTLPAEDAWD